MKTPVAAALMVLIAAAWLLADPPESKSTDTAEATTGTYKLELSLTDAETGEPVSGVVRFQYADGETITPDGLLRRGLGINDKSSIHDWCVVPGPVTVELPRAPLTVTAFSGIDTAHATRTLEPPAGPSGSLKIPLTRFADPRTDGWWNANTHVHLMKITRGESDQYLVDVGRADGLDLVYVSYLERAEADVDYTTNRYSRHELQALSDSHVHFDHGEEHRHNFGGGGEGYGHVMLLAIPELVYPVSIGPGISKTGTDGLPLRRGIERAHDIGGTVIWCHNAWGLEDIPSWLSGKLEANNIFDGGTHGSYHSSFYRYLDVGIKVPFSTGTDWFIYDFSRVYIPASERPTSEEWLDQLAAGRSYITNGPLLEFSVNEQGIGEDIKLAEPGKVRVTGRAVGRVDFQRLELVQSGRVVATIDSSAQDDHFTAELDTDLDISKSCWLALRTPPPSYPEDPDHEKTPLNEYGRELFSHTSATFIDIAGRRMFDKSAAEELLEEMTKNREFISEEAVFADDAERNLVLSVYDEGIALLNGRIDGTGK